MSRTIKFAQAGGPEVLEFIETQVPAPGPHEVRIAVKAIGINRAESMWRNDKYIQPVKFPAGLGYDAAGIVDAVGKDVTDFAIGDAVSAIPAFSLNQYFTYGEVILVPDYVVVKHPKSLSFVEAASVWMMFITAYGALIQDAKVAKGDFVLIPAASSSVGLAAIQIANYAGAKCIAIWRTAANSVRSSLPFDRSEQHARTLHWRMPMRLSALRIDDGTNTLGCLPLQRMPAAIRQRLRHVHNLRVSPTVATRLRVCSVPSAESASIMF